VFSLVERIEKFVAANPLVCLERFAAVDVACCHIRQQLLIPYPFSLPLALIMIAAQTLLGRNFLDFFYSVLQCGSEKDQKFE
jgi:hypothetical protein